MDDHVLELNKVNLFGNRLNRITIKPLQKEPSLEAKMFMKTKTKDAIDQENFMNYVSIPEKNADSPTKTASFVSSVL